MVQLLSHQGAEIMSGGSSSNKKIQFGYQLLSPFSRSGIISK